MPSDSPTHPPQPPQANPTPAPPQDLEALLALLRASFPTLSTQFQSGARYLLDHAQMVGARDGDLDVLSRRRHFGGDGKRVEKMVGFADEQEKDAHQPASTSAAFSKSTARHPCSLARRTVLSPRPTSHASFASANIGASLT